MGKCSGSSVKGGGYNRKNNLRQPISYEMKNGKLIPVYEDNQKSIRILLTHKNK